jgi:hypothetical protein
MLGITHTMSISELARASASTWTPAPPASEHVLSSLCQAVGFELPSDYLDFLRFSDGGCGSIPVDPWCFDSLWKATELAEFNRNYQIQIYCPGFFGIGSTGGGDMFAFDMRGEEPWPVVSIPCIGMEPAAALPVAPDFRSFVAMFGQKGSRAA